jgi:hypothetical protein
MPVAYIRANAGLDPMNNEPREMIAVSLDAYVLFVTVCGVYFIVLEVTRFPWSTVGFTRQSLAASTTLKRFLRVNGDPGGVLPLRKDLQE